MNEKYLKLKMESVVNKLLYKDNQSDKILNKNKNVVVHTKPQIQNISPNTRRRENMILSILLTGDLNLYEIIKQNINSDDFKDELNKQIAKKLYEEFEKGNSNINGILDELSEEEQGHITEIMADDYGIEDMEKAIDDVIHAYQRDKLNDRKLEILSLLEENPDPSTKKELEKELNELIIKLVKIK